MWRGRQFFPEYSFAAGQIEREDTQLHVVVGPQEQGTAIAAPLEDRVAILVTLQRLRLASQSQRVDVIPPVSADNSQEPFVRGERSSNEALFRYGLWGAALDVLDVGASRTPRFCGR